MIVRCGFALALVFAGGALLPAPAEAISYSFTSCFDNNSGLCSELAPQLQVEVTTAAGNSVDFTFTNEIGIASSITDIYFDADGFLKNMTVVGQSAGVDFAPGANPGDPPGGSQASPAFEVTHTLLASANPPSADNGINSTSESLTVRFKIQGGQSFDDIIAALNAGPDTADGIRIAAHVQGIGPNGDSDTFICCTGGDNVSVPEPALMALFGIGLFAVAARARRRKSA
jgi:hypothetical protein